MFLGLVFISNIRHYFKRKPELSLKHFSGLKINLYNRINTLSRYVFIRLYSSLNDMLGKNITIQKKKTTTQIQTYMIELELVILNHKLIPRKVVEHKVDKWVVATFPKTLVSQDRTSTEIQYINSEAVKKKWASQQNTYKAITNAKHIMVAVRESQCLSQLPEILTQAESLFSYDY